ncbi:MAG TPA: ParB/RepB/Spo0J family partition protein [Steroidobacteraceae bacterium]|nr:ParB/RepB/Spo0J family partition protein [Steroidobacteraceae bacterium]
MDVARLEVDLHLLELRFTGARLIEPQSVERLARSIERDGQIVPLIVVGSLGSSEAGSQRLVLIDGYRRVAALRRLGRDRACVERWPCDLAEALLGVLARTQSRSFAAIEEALLLRELTQGLGVSQREIGRRCGRDDSWVNRRLQLLSALPESGLAAVCAGRLSTWAATRVIAPLARASSAHAEQLVAALGEAPLSTRELRHWFDHYQKARRVVRERMVKHPKLFLQALNESAAQDRTERLRVGPEGECETDLWRINELICRVRKRLGMLTPLSQELVQALTSAQVNFEGLQDDIKRLSQHDPDRDPQRRKASQGAGPEPARDQPAFEAVA